MSIRADAIEREWEKILAVLTVPDDWGARIKEIAGNADQRAEILRERAQVQKKWRRAKTLCRDELMDDLEYRREVG